MAIKFFNIKSKEVRVAETEPQISALWASSDHSPNITQGQDFGWRLAPEVVVEMQRIKQDINQLMVIATRGNISTDEINETHILAYISAKVPPENAPVADDEDYSDEYSAEIRRIRQEVEEKTANPPADLPTVPETDPEPQTATTTEEPTTPPATDPDTTTTTTQPVE